VRFEVVLDLRGGSFLVELDQDGRHVVHAVLIAAVLRDKFVEEFFADFFEFFAIETVLDPVHHLTVGLDLPDAVASHNNKIYVLVFDFDDVWLGGNHLVLRLEAFILFVLSVPECPREVESTVDSAEVDSASSLGNSINFLRIFGFMVFAELLGLSLDASHRSRVPSISAINEVRSDQDNICRAACMTFLLVFGPILFLSHLFLDGDDLFSAFLAEDHIIHFHEGFLKRLFVFHRFVVWVSFQLIDKVPFHKSGYFGS